MTVTLWIINVILALAFLMAGMMKVAQPKDALLKRGMGWAADFSGGAVKLIGLMEIVGAVGLIVPFATGIAAIVTPIAAICLAAVMIGAVVVHVRRKEAPTPALALAIVAAASAVVGFLAI